VERDAEQSGQHWLDSKAHDGPAIAEHQPHAGLQIVAAMARGGSASSLLADIAQEESEPRK
jgi:hypothetical protein